MKTYTREQALEAMYALYHKDNKERKRPGFTAAQYTHLGMVIAALNDLDKQEAATTPTLQ